MSKTNFEVYMKHLKVLVKFTCVYTISLNFDIYFLKFLWEIVFSVIPGRKKQKKNKNNCTILKVILVQGFCPLKIEITRFAIWYFNAVNVSTVCARIRGHQIHSTIGPCIWKSNPKRKHTLNLAILYHYVNYIMLLDMLTNIFCV